MSLNILWESSKQLPRHTFRMSRPVLSSAVRQISRPRPTRATFSALSSSVPNPTPSFSASFCNSSYRTPTVPSAPRQRNSRVRCAGYRTRTSTTWLNAVQPRSAFSTSAPTSAPQVTQNPRAGEDGETLMVGISERAANVRSQTLLCLSGFLFSVCWRWRIRLWRGYGMLAG